MDSPTAWGLKGNEALASFTPARKYSWGEGGNGNLRFSPRFLGLAVSGQNIRHNTGFIPQPFRKTPYFCLAGQAMQKPGGIGPVLISKGERNAIPPDLGMTQP